MNQCFEMNQFGQRCELKHGHEGPHLVTIKSYWKNDILTPAKAGGFHDGTKN